MRLGPVPRAFESVTCSLESDLSAEMEWMDCPMLSLWTRGDYLPMAPGKFFSFSEFWAKGPIWLHNNFTDLSGSWNYVEYALKSWNSMGLVKHRLSTPRTVVMCCYHHPVRTLGFTQHSSPVPVPQLSRETFTLLEFQNQANIWNKESTYNLYILIT